MSGVNKAILVGHLGKDPKVSTTNSGSRVVSFSVATSETWKDKTTGERKEKTEWHNVAIYNEGLGKIAEAYLKKGSQVYLEGAIRTRKYTAQDGSERYTTEIVLAAFRGELTLLGSASQRPAAEESAYGTTRTRDTAPAARPAAGGPDLDDDIPF